MRPCKGDEHAALSSWHTRLRLSWAQTGRRLLRTLAFHGTSFVGSVYINFYESFEYIIYQAVKGNQVAGLLRNQAGEIAPSLSW